jgi:hypothetical protein
MIKDKRLGHYTLDFRPVKLEVFTAGHEQVRIPGNSLAFPIDLLAVVPYPSFAAGPVELQTSMINKIIPSVLTYIYIYIYIYKQIK